MHFNIPAFTLALALVVLQTEARPEGAPTLACSSMVPSHGTNSQPSPCPYVTEPEKLSVHPGGVLKLKLRHSSNEDTFKGFLLQAQDSDTSQPIGTFQTSEYVKTVNCLDGENNAVTHKDRSSKGEVEVSWIPPKDYEGFVIFKTTFVKDLATFWIKEPSVPVRVDRSADFASVDAFDSSSMSAALFAVYGIVLIGATISFMV